MTPQQLQSWQPQASYEQLQAFIDENRTLMTLLEETWQQFMAQETAKLQRLPEKTYGLGLSFDDLQHFPVSEDELAQFLVQFERENPRNDRPFGDNPKITEYDWTLSD